MIAEFVGDLLATAASNLSWQDNAACRGLGTEAFYPTKGGDGGAAAKRVCRGCPVLARCWQWGIDHEDDGVWGGTTPNERKALREKSGMDSSVDAWLAEHAEGIDA